MTQQLSTNTFGVAKWVVSPDATQGTHTTIASALTSASSGDTIIIRDGTYTENLTGKAGVTLSALGGDNSLNATGKVIISGNLTFSAAGTMSLFGIQLQTNSAALLTVSGSSASVVNIENCYLNCTNNTGIVFSSSSSSANINIRNSSGNLATTGIAVFDQSSAGSLIFYGSDFTNTGGSTTANTISAGSLHIRRSAFDNPITTSGTSLSSFSQAQIYTAPQNATSYTCGGSGANLIVDSIFQSGTATAISISASLSLYDSTLNSSNTNCIDGAGTILQNGNKFIGSQKINTTTQTSTGLGKGLVTGNAAIVPTSGMIGERLTSTVTAVALTTATNKTITSISLTAGIWDVSCIAQMTPTGGTGVMQIGKTGISTTDNAYSGTEGSESGTISGSSLGITTISVPVVRATVISTTTYYLVCTAFYTSTTCPANGRITAIRVG